MCSGAPYGVLAAGLKLRNVAGVGILLLEDSVAARLGVPDRHCERSASQNLAFAMQEIG
jgi:hypothetical protein